MEIMIKGKNRKYRITSDTRQFILSEKKKTGTESNEPGRVYFDEIGYFAKLDSLLDRVVMLELGDMEITTLAELLSEIRGMRAWFSELFNGKVAA